MRLIQYQDFDLQVQATATGFRSQVLKSPAGEASSISGPIFTDLELENYLLKMGRPRRVAVRRLDSPEVAAAKALGGRLFAAVFSGEVRECLYRSVDFARRRGAGLRLRLRLKEALELANYPWEYLYDQNLNWFLALSNDTPIVRYLDLPTAIAPLKIELPLHILAMISDPINRSDLDSEREWRLLNKAVAGLQRDGKVVLERLESATMEALDRCLRRHEYHILHFIGHGAFDRRIDDGVLVLEDRNKRERWITGEDLGIHLRDHRTLRLVVLNSCEGARGSAQDPFSGVAQSLVQQRLPAVIAMQFEITDEAAIAFSGGFYAPLAEGYPVEAALAQARKTIHASTHGLEWGTPVLYLRAPDGVLFKPQKSKPRSSQGAQRLKSLAPPQSAKLAHNFPTDVRSVFISYAHTDNESPNRKERWLDRFVEFLKPLVRQEDFTLCSDQDIKIGQDWHQHIQAHLSGAKAVVLLVSPAFLASEYIANSELPVILKNVADQGVRIFPILISPSVYKRAKYKYPDPKIGPREFTLASIQAANPPSETLIEMTEGGQSRVLEKVAEQLAELLSGDAGTAVVKEVTTSPPVMSEGSDRPPTVHLVLTSSSGADEWELDLPKNLAVQRIVAVLLQKSEFGFRKHDGAGNLVPYRIRWKEGNRYLGETETLAEAGVQENHSLVMTPNTIHLILTSTFGADEWDVDLPANIAVQRIVAVLLQKPEFGLRKHDGDGNLVPYRIVWKEGNRYLGETETLAGAGVQEHHTLVMTH
jgi:CHAT domain-containing protein/TIR domain-containing protein